MILVESFENNLVLEKWLRNGQTVKNIDAFVGDLGSIPSTHVGQFITSVSLVPGNLTPSPGLLEYCTYVVHVQMSWHIHKCIHENKF